MKKKVIFPFITLLSVFSILACSRVDALSNFKELRNPDSMSHSYNYNDIRKPEYVAFKNKMHLFASKLSESFAKREYSDSGNYTCSPLSIELCLGLAIRSASGETRQEILNALDVDYATFNEFYKLYFNELTFTVKDEYDVIASELLLSNSIWIDDEVTLLDSGLDALKDDYYTHSYEVDFNHKNKESNEAIKEFINKKTNGLINQNLNISPETLFTLINTLYLKDIWNDVGRDLSYTKEDYHFTYQDGHKSNKQLLDGYYFMGKAIENDNYSSFYTETHSGLNLHFVKPNNGVSILNIFNKDTIEYVTNYSNYVLQDDTKLERYYTNCVFPEFKAECDTDLIPIFQEDYHVNKLFSEQCDLSNLSTNQVYCSDFKHIAKLNVNKKGIEGAAVTFMAYAGASGPDEYEEVYSSFIVDKEFGFVLTYRNSILFSGIVTNID
jgi:serine protease inhibitor